MRNERVLVVNGGSIGGNLDWIERRVCDEKCAELLASILEESGDKFNEKTMQLGLYALDNAEHRPKIKETFDLYIGRHRGTQKSKFVETVLENILAASFLEIFE